MKWIIPFAIALIVLGVAIAYGPIPIAEEIESPASDPVFIEENSTGRLYKVDLNSGPLYYYEIDTENGTIIKVVAMTTMYLSINA